MSPRRQLYLVWARNPSSRLSSEIGVHILVFEEKSLVSKGACGKLRNQHDVRDLLQLTLESQRVVRMAARPCLEQNCTGGNCLKLVVPGNTRVERREQTSYRWCRGECEVERKHEVCDRITVNVEATKVRETDRLNCFRFLKELLLDSHLAVDTRKKFDARLEVVFEEVVAFGGLEAGVGQDVC